MSKPENDRRIDYVELTVGDLDRAKRFYSQAFGWKFTDYGPGYSAFDDGRLQGGLTQGEVKAGSVRVILYAIDLEGAAAAVKAAGGTIVKPIFSFPGGRRFHFGDPGGNELAVWSDR